jgi:folate-dependent phosphoribosylglycinamide formyltransferase PurN
MASDKQSGLVVFATKDVGRDAFNALIAAGTELTQLYVIRAADTEILASAKAAGVPADILTDEDLDRMVAVGKRYGWLLNLWADWILPADFLHLFDHRLNLHPSLLPHCRGNDCATWAIREREPSGVSLVEMDVGIDTGAIYVQKAVPYDFPETAADLQRRLKTELVQLFRDNWPDIYAGRVDAVPQTGEGSYHRRRDTVADRMIAGDGTMKADELIDRVLAHDFSPDSTALLTRNGKTYRLRLDLRRVD